MRRASLPACALPGAVTPLALVSDLPGVGLPWRLFVVDTDETRHAEARPGLRRLRLDQGAGFGPTFDCRPFSSDLAPLLKLVSLGRGETDSLSSS